MRLKLDENLPRRFALLFEAHGHDAWTAIDEGLGGKHDRAVARVAASEGRMVVTLDKRFADLRTYPLGTHPGFLVIRTTDQSTLALERLLRALLAAHDLDELGGCIVVLEPGHLRVRRPR